MFDSDKAIKSYNEDELVRSNFVRLFDTSGFNEIFYVGITFYIIDCHSYFYV